MAGKCPTELRRKSFPEEARARIKTGMILTKLHKVVRGSITMTPTQLKAAEILLSRTLPALSQVTLDVSNNGHVLRSIEITPVNSVPMLTNTQVSTLEKQVLDDPIDAEYTTTQDASVGKELQEDQCAA